MLHCYLCNKSWPQSLEPLYSFHMARMHHFNIDSQIIANRLAFLVMNRVPAAEVSYDTLLNQLIEFVYEAGLTYSMSQPREVYDFVAGLISLYYPHVVCPSRIQVKPI